ncbi:MAG: hypothetical protein HY758_02955 [Nitrospirae bacterium]|nr:hypothetical protein [Nitrospirota bacterium]
MKKYSDEFILDMPWHPYCKTKPSMPSGKKIVILDEDGFSKVCSAMLADDGHQTEMAMSGAAAMDCISMNGASLIVASYPYGMTVLTSQRVKEIPVIILSDEINNDLIEMMKNFDYSVCMVKPVDFQRFKYLVRGIVHGYLNLKGGNIIA